MEESVAGLVNYHIGQKQCLIKKYAFSESTWDFDIRDSSLWRLSQGASVFPKFSEQGEELTGRAMNAGEVREEEPQH